MSFKFDMAREDKEKFLDEQEKQTIGALYRFYMDKKKMKKLMALDRFKDANAQMQYMNKLNEIDLQELECGTILDTIADLRKELEREG